MTMGNAMRAVLIGAALLCGLSGCDAIQQRMGIVDPAAKAAQAEADGKAVGGACRHAMRGLEDCYTLNPKSPKALVFAGWKDMDEYMRSNKIEGVPSVLGQSAPEKRAPEADSNSASRNRS